MSQTQAIIVGCNVPGFDLSTVATMHIYGAVRERLIESICFAYESSYMNKSFGYDSDRAPSKSAMSEFIVGFKSCLQRPNVGDESRHAESKRPRRERGLYERLIAQSSQFHQPGSEPVPLLDIAVYKSKSDFRVCSSNAFRITDSYGASNKYRAYIQPWLAVTGIDSANLDFSGDSNGWRFGMEWAATTDLRVLMQDADLKKQVHKASKRVKYGGGRLPSRDLQEYITFALHPGSFTSEDRDSLKITYQKTGQEGLDEVHAQKCKVFCDALSLGAEPLSIVEFVPQSMGEMLSRKDLQAVLGSTVVTTSVSDQSSMFPGHEVHM